MHIYIYIYIHTYTHTHTHTHTNTHFFSRFLSSSLFLSLYFARSLALSFFLSFFLSLPLPSSLSYPHVLIWILCLNLSCEGIIQHFCDLPFFCFRSEANQSDREFGEIEANQKDRIGKWRRGISSLTSALQVFFWLDQHRLHRFRPELTKGVKIIEMGHPESRIVCIF